jgi:2-haloacid dehalogenase
VPDRMRDRRAGDGAGPYRTPLAMPLPKNVEFVTFDCYGTLIDWELGVYDAFQKEADRDGFTIDRNELIPRFIDIQREIQRGSYELYAEVLRRTAVRVAEELGWQLEPSRSNFLPDSVPRWPPFRETNAQLERFAKKYEIGVLSNIDDKLLGATRRHFRTDFDLVVTAQQVRSYKPDPAHFKECARRIEGKKKRWVHIGSGYPTDVEPCIKQRVPVIWVNRHGEKLEQSQKKPTEEVKSFRDAGKLLGAA